MGINYYLIGEGLIPPLAPLRVLAVPGCMESRINKHYFMSKTYAFLFALISFIEMFAQAPSKPAEQGVTLGDFYLMHARWMVAEGEQAKRMEEERIKAKMKSPGFIRDELFREYIKARSMLEFRQAELGFIVTTKVRDSDLEYKNRISDATIKAIEEQNAKGLRILDILSRLPDPANEIPGPPALPVSR